MTVVDVAPVIQRPCDIRLSRQARVATITVTGRIDWIASHTFRDLLRAADADPILIVDLCEAEPLNSVPIGMLLAAIPRRHHQGHQIAVVASSSEQIEVLSANELPIVIPLFATRPEVATWAAAQPAA